MTNFPSSEHFRFGIGITPRHTQKKMNSFGGKGIILLDTEKEVLFPPGFEPPIHELRGEHSTTELPDLLMNEHKSSV